MSHGRYTQRVNEGCRSTYWDKKFPMWQSQKYTIPKFTWNGCISPPQLEVYSSVFRLATNNSPKDFGWNFQSLGVTTQLKWALYCMLIIVNPFKVMFVPMVAMSALIDDPPCHDEKPETPTVIHWRFDPGKKRKKQRFTEDLSATNRLEYLVAHPT